MTIFYRSVCPDCQCLNDTEAGIAEVVCHNCGETYCDESEPDEEYCSAQAWAEKEYGGQWQ
jgi:hypothetical protein